jgi:uncharacterized membrane protein YhaH (DUF805 family)
MVRECFAMTTASSQLPVFVFPVIAWTPHPATGEAGDDGTRSFLALDDVTITYMPESDLRLGWTFVDAEGRCWEAVSSRVIGRAEAWWARWWPGWFYDRKYRLAMDFAERPPITFDGVKTRLHAGVTANPQAYRGYTRQRRNELGSAQSLRDLIKSEETLAIERLRPEPLWWQWLFAEGRCSRLTFVGVMAVLTVLVALVWLVIVWRQLPAPALLLILVLSLMSLSAVVRRLHDLRRSAWWIAAWFLFSFLCAFVHDTASIPAVKMVAASTWQITTLCVLAFLALAPGTRGPNRYGV